MNAVRILSGLFSVVVCAAQDQVGDPSLTLAPIFSDHMVLQRERPVPIWGTAAPDELVRVCFAGQEKTSRASTVGHWRVTLDPLVANDVPSELLVNGGPQRSLRRQDVLVGEVWLGSGQSNMVWRLTESTAGETFAAQADHPWLRLSSDTLWPPPHSYQTPETGWVVCSPQTARRFSAQMFHFALALRERHRVPIGVIARAVSGSAAGPWLSTEHFQANAGCRAAWQAHLTASQDKVARYQLELADWQTKQKSVEQAFAERLAALPKVAHQCRLRLINVLPALTSDDDGWNHTRDLGLILSHDGQGWKMQAKAFILKTSYPATLTATGPASDTYISLTIGATLPATVDWRAGQWAGPASQKSVTTPLPNLGRLEMTIQAQRQGKEVQGTWTLNGSSGTLQGEILREAKEQIPRQPQSPVQDPPLGEWWGRFIAPVAPYALRGICWDQGESGTNVPGVDLPTLMPALVAGWRQSWEDLNLPWIFVQKPSGGGWRWQPGQQTLISRPQQPAITPDLLSQGFERENYQRLMQLPRSGMVNCLDLDDGLHPLGKEAYARRMVAIAEHLAYGGPQNTLAPVLKEIQVKGQTLRLVFDHHGRGLRALGGEPLQGFMIAGEDRVFTWAEARIEADTVVLSTQIPKPVAARYAWAQQVPWANLADGDGRLVLTFRTDDWPQPPIPAKR